MNKQLMLLVMIPMIIIGHIIQEFVQFLSLFCLLLAVCRACKLEIRVFICLRGERIAKTPSFHGVIESFCREKGHGFIIPDDNTEHVFLHISKYVFIG
jgi:hypothetical protein